MKSLLGWARPDLSHQSSFRERLEELAREHEQLEEAYRDRIIASTGLSATESKYFVEAANVPSSSSAGSSASCPSINIRPTTPTFMKPGGGFAQVPLPPPPYKGVSYMPRVGTTYDPDGSEQVASTQSMDSIEGNDITECPSTRRKRRALRQLSQNEVCAELADLEKSMEEPKMLKLKHSSSSTIFNNPYENLDIPAPQLDEDHPFCTRLRVACYSIVQNKVFDFLISMFIIADSVMVGIDAQNSLNPFISDKSVVHQVTLVISVVFHVELLLRIFAYGMIDAFKLSVWIRFDAALVLFSNTEFFINLVFERDIGFVRAFRCVRLCRLAKVMVSFRTLWFLLSGLRASIDTLVSTMVLIGLISYAFAVTAMALLPPKDLNQDTLYNEVASTHFGTIADSVITFLQLATFDSVASVYRPLIVGSDWGLASSCFFTAYALLVSIALMNLVTALMVDATFKQAQSDREAQRAWEENRKKRLMPKLRALFASLDYDGSGEVTLEEILHAPTEIKEELQALLRSDNLEEIFNLLDDDDSGSVQINEFFEAILKATSDNGHVLQSLQIARLVRQMRKLLTITVEIATGIVDKVEEVGDDDNATCTQATQCLRTSLQQYHEALNLWDARGKAAL